MTRLIYVALYTAAMLALSWVLWQIVPPIADWLFSHFGNAVFWVSFALWAALGVWLYRLHRRHPEWSINYRKRSDKFLEPRDP